MTSVNTGSAAMHPTPNPEEARLSKRILELQTAIQVWARERDLWHDCGFKSAQFRTDLEPDDYPIITILWFEGPLFQMFNGTFDDGSEESFFELVTSLGFEYDLYDHVSCYFYATDDVERLNFAAYFKWKWICSLVEDDFADVYEEIYSHFGDRPEDLQRLGWREFEILVGRALATQGFSVEIGPGSGDQGVDLRLLQRDPLGDILTLVQVKRYASRRKINLQAVQALYGATHYEGAHRGLFVTTSEYLPGVRTWSEKVDDRLELATSSDVAKWCEQASRGIIENKEKLVSTRHIQSLLARSGKERNFDNILHANSGFGMTMNNFALLVKETRHAALLVSLPSVVQSHDGFGQMGYELPDLDPSKCAQTPAIVFRARKRVHGENVYYSDGRNSYSRWDGQPCHFNYCD